MKLKSYIKNINIKPYISYIIIVTILSVSIICLSFYGNSTNKEICNKEKVLIENNALKRDSIYQKTLNEINRNLTVIQDQLANLSAQMETLSTSNSDGYKNIEQQIKKIKSTNYSILNKIHSSIQNLNDTTFMTQKHHK